MIISRIIACSAVVLIIAIVLFRMTVRTQSSGNRLIQSSESRVVDFGNGKLTSFPAVKIRENPFANKHSQLSFDKFRGFCYAFVLAGGSYSILRISRNGEASYTFLQQTDGNLTPKQARFTLAQEEVVELCDKLESNQFLDLHDEYDANLTDYLLIDMSVQCDSFSKSVRCNGHFPVSIEGIVQFIEVNILDGHKAQLEDSVQITDKEFNKFERCID